MGNLVTESLIATSILATLALPFCIFRLWIRIRIQRLGWEDIWAILAFACGTVNVLIDWVYVIRQGSESARISTWIYTLTLTCLVWSVRISIIFSIIRVIPTRERLHTYGLTIVAGFLLACFAFWAQDAVQCARMQYTDTIESHFLCSMPRSWKIARLAVGCLADTISTTFPLYVLRTVKPPPRVHQLLRLLFSFSLVVSIMCTIRAVCQLVPELTHWSVVVANSQITVCLVACNLLVIVTYLYRVLGRKGRDSTVDSTDQDSATEKDDLTMSSPVPGQMTLTTIEHLFSMQSGDSISAVSDGTVSKSVSGINSSC